MKKMVLAMALIAPLPAAAQEAAQVEVTAEAANPAQAIATAMELADAGEIDAARAILQEVVTDETRWRVELANGEWVDSRHLARRALLALDRRDDGTRMAAR